MPSQSSPIDFRNFAEVKLPAFRYYHLAAIILIIVYLFSFEYLPLQDYPDWLYQGHLFNQYVFHGNDYGGYFTMHPYLPPNAISTLSIGILELIVSTFIAGKIFLFFALALNYYGFTRFLGRNSNISDGILSVIAMYFTFNLHFLIANISFLFGLGFAITAFCIIVERSKLSSFWVLVPVYLLCYLSHFFALIIFMILIISETKKAEGIKRIKANILALAPTVLLFVHYCLVKTITTFRADNLDSSTIELFFAKIAVVKTMSIPFHRYKGIYELPLGVKYLNLIIASIAIIAIILSLWFILRDKLRSSLARIIAACIIILIIMPYELAGVYFPAERFMILLLLSLIALYSKIILLLPIRRIAAFIMIALTLSAYSYNWIQLSAFNSIVASKQIPSAGSRKQYDVREGTDPFSRMEYYDAIREDRPILIFTTGLFTYRGANPATFDGK